MPHKPTILASDLEGVLVPEIWIAVAEKTGIERLRLTTRDIPNYDELMAGRIAILREHKLTLTDIQAVIATVEPLPGALEFLDWARAQMQVIILSDTFYEFAAPLMLKLGQPTLFCNTITADAGNNIAGYQLRQIDGKRKAVLALQSLDFRVIAMAIPIMTQPCWARPIRAFCSAHRPISSPSSHSSRCSMSIIDCANI